MRVIGAHCIRIRVLPAIKHRWLPVLSLFQPPDTSMATSKQLQKLTRDDVAKHDKADDLVRMDCLLNGVQPNIHLLHLVGHN
jgi:hypothetical protein